MRTYKFLGKGALGPISGFSWPAQGVWVEAKGPLGLCASGAHVCRRLDLAYWIHDELWETESAGEQLEGVDCLVVRRARLLRRIDGWHDGGSTRFAEACARRAADLAPASARGFVDDAFDCARNGFVAPGAFAAAVAVVRSATGPQEEQTCYRRERAWQSDWIARLVIGDA
jgi:hypothetical protein